MPSAPAIFFLSDYGTADEFVGVVHAVLHRFAPLVPVVDLSHQVAPFDVPGGAAMLVRCAPHLGAGVVLAVVDPGVGTGRRALALRTATDGSAGGPGPAGPSWLVGPDNGLLVPMATAYGGIDSAVGIDRDGPVIGDRHRVVADPGDPGPTFDGRDVFAPAAAHLVLGGDPALLGPAVDPASLVTVVAGGGVPRDVAGGGETSPAGAAVLTTVASVDRFGNVQLEAGPADWEEAALPSGGTVAVTVLTGPVAGIPGVPAGLTGTRSGPVRARRVQAYAELDEGEFGLLTDGTGHLALVLDRRSAAAALDPVEVGAVVSIAPAVAEP